MVTKDRSEELRIRSSQLNDQIDFPIRFEDHWNETDNLMPFPQTEWIKVEGFLSVVEQIQQQITLLESYVKDVKVKHSQLSNQLLLSPHEDQSRLHKNCRKLFLRLLFRFVYCRNETRIGFCYGCV